MNTQIEQMAEALRQIANDAWEAAKSYTFAEEYGRVPNRFPDKETWIKATLSTYNPEQVTVEFKKEDMDKVQKDIDEVMAGKIIDKAKLLNNDVVNDGVSDGLKQLLHEVQQVLSGYAQDDTWSDYDESVRKRVLEMQYSLETLPSTVAGESKEGKDDMEDAEFVLDGYESVSVMVDYDQYEDHYPKGCVLQAMKEYAEQYRNQPHPLPAQPVGDKEVFWTPELVVKIVSMAHKDGYLKTSGEPFNANTYVMAFLNSIGKKEFDDYLKSLSQPAPVAVEVEAVKFAKWIRKEKYEWAVRNNKWWKTGNPYTYFSEKELFTLYKETTPQ